MAGVLAADVPLVGSQSNGQYASCEGGGRVEVDDTCTAVVDHMVPCAEHMRAGKVFPCLHHVGAGSQTVGIEVPHAVVVALHAGTLEGVDAALVESADELHAAIDVVVAMVVDLTLGITDDGLRAPDVAVLTTLAIAIDAGSIGVGNTAHGNGELCGMVGEEEVTTVGGESFQRLDGVGRCQSAGQVLPALLDADAIAHHPACRLFLDVEVVDGGGSEQHALAGADIVLLEPGHSVFLVG